MFLSFYTVNPASMKRFKEIVQHLNSSDSSDSDTPHDHVVQVTKKGNNVAMLNCRSNNAAQDLSMYPIGEHSDVTHTDAKQQEPKRLILSTQLHREKLDSSSSVKSSGKQLESPYLQPLHAVQPEHAYSSPHDSYPLQWMPYQTPPWMPYQQPAQTGENVASPRPPTSQNLTAPEKIKTESEYLLV